MELSSNENSVVTVDDEKDNDINPINNDQVPNSRQNNEGADETSPVTGQYNPAD